MLDDYALMARAALAIYEASGDEALVQQAAAWVEVVETHFLDADSGVWYFTADDAEALIVRTLSLTDNATPNGNGVMLDVLARLWRITGDSRWRDRLDRAGLAFSHQVSRNFFPLATALNAMAFDMAGLDIVIVGDPGDSGTALLIDAALTAGPDRLLQVISPDQVLPDGHPAAGKGRVDGQAAAYLCRQMVCGLPITDPAELVKDLREG